ncbi:MAG: hypothetical protein ABID40_02470 [Candidatus Bipolaricaulota bacterium]
MIELTSHQVEGAPGCRVFAVDEPDHEKGGGAHHVYAIVWGETTQAHLDGLLPKMLDTPPDHPLASPIWGYEGAAAAGEPVVGILLRFQRGPIKEFGANGLDGESLLAILAHRLTCFQAGPFACESNARALTSVVEAQYQSGKRTRDRVARQVEGLNVK